jgi:hypothetical protein
MNPEPRSVRCFAIIANMRKIVFPCPLCREQDSCIVPADAKTSCPHKCAHCRGEFLIDLRSVALD